jgi:excisionase family DNA binding protein
MEPCVMNISPNKQLGAGVGRVDNATQDLGVAEAAKYLGVSTDYLYRRSASGEIPNYKIAKKLRFRVSDLDTFRESLRRSREG